MTRKRANGEAVECTLIATGSTDGTPYIDFGYEVAQPKPGEHYCAK